MIADKRVNHLWAFYCYLVKYVSFDRFPSPGMYVKGIPIVIYHGILQNCCTHMSLYSLSARHTYNVCSISSLVCESFFSTVSSRDPHKLGCPKAADIPKTMGDIITIENYKNHTDLNFHLEKLLSSLCIHHSDLTTS